MIVSHLLLSPDPFQAATGPAAAEPILYSVPFPTLRDQLVPLRHPSDVFIVYLEFIGSINVRRHDLRRTLIPVRLVELILVLTEQGLALLGGLPSLTRGERVSVQHRCHDLGGRGQLRRLALAPRAVGELPGVVGAPMALWIPEQGYALNPTSSSLHLLIYSKL